MSDECKSVSIFYFMCGIVFGVAVMMVFVWCVAVDDNNEQHRVIPTATPA